MSRQPPEIKAISKLHHYEKFLGPAADSCYIRVETIHGTRPLRRVFVFLGYDPSADG
jgi:hypothetical protein